MLGNFFKKVAKSERLVVIKEVSVTDAILITRDIPRVERAVEAYVNFQNQVGFGGISSQDAPELRRRTETIYESLADSGVKLIEESTSYGVDDTLHLFVKGYMNL
jgi:hypothetical protein